MIGFIKFYRGILGFNEAKDSISINNREYKRYEIDNISSSQYESNYRNGSVGIGVKIYKGVYVKRSVPVNNKIQNEGICITLKNGHIIDLGFCETPDTNYYSILNKWLSGTTLSQIDNEIAQSARYGLIFVVVFISILIFILIGVFR